MKNTLGNAGSFYSNPTENIKSPNKFNTQKLPKTPQNSRRLKTVDVSSSWTRQDDHPTSTKTTTINPCHPSMIKWSIPHTELGIGL
jgi:hypothetical protein